MKSKNLSLTILALAVVGVVLISGCAKKGCKTVSDCEDKTCFTTVECEDNTCVYSPIADCCGNDICESGESYSECSADCPNCDDNDGLTADSFNYETQECEHIHLRPITLGPATPEDDYQIKIELTASNFDYSKTKANGEDIRFFDGDDDQLNYWIEDWNVGGTSTVWVKVDDSGTDEIYMYYGNPDVNSAGSGPAVFEFFDGFDYMDESELTQVWGKHGSPTIELSDSIVTVTASEGQQHIYRDVGSSTLLNNIVEIRAKRFSGPGYHNHMANIGYVSPNGGPISDGDSWAVSRYGASPDGGLVVFGGNHGGVAPSPFDSFNIIKFYHQGGTSYAYEPPGTKVAEYSWPMDPPPGDYVLLGGQTYVSGSGKASYDWIRVRKYASAEPSASVGNEMAAGGLTIPMYD
jgi:hypothetical protein